MLGLLWLGATLGTTFILTRSSLFAPVRNLVPKKKGHAPTLGTLVRCPKCVGTWMGALWALLFAWCQGAAVSNGTLYVQIGDVGFARPEGWLVTVFAFAYGTSGAIVCWLADLVFRKLGGDKVMAHERHPFQDLPKADRDMVLSVLREGAKEHARYAATVQGSDVSAGMKKTAIALHQERAAVYTTAIDALER